MCICLSVACFCYGPFNCQKHLLTESFLKKNNWTLVNPILNFHFYFVHYIMSLNQLDDALAQVEHQYQLFSYRRQ